MHAGSYGSRRAVVALIAMSTDTPQELAGMKAAGQRRRRDDPRAAQLVRPGITTAELDAAAARASSPRHGARSGPQLDYDFPGAICISRRRRGRPRHPRARRLREGQLVKLDVTAELDGFYADACRTVPVGKAKRRAAAAHRPQPSRRSSAGSRAATAGATVNDIGAARAGRGRDAAASPCCAELTGHGIGRRIHEDADGPERRTPGPSPR